MLRRLAEAAFLPGTAAVLSLLLLLPVPEEQGQQPAPFFGSMSIVGVNPADYQEKPGAKAPGFSQLEGPEDTRAEVVKRAVTKGNTFENLDFVVASFCEAVGIRAIKSIEDVRFPVFQNSKERIEFRNIGNHCVNPEF